MALGLPRRASLSLVMAGGFLADTTSVSVTTSNLVNTLSSDFFHLAFLGLRSSSRSGSSATV